MLNPKNKNKLLATIIIAVFAFAIAAPLITVSAHVPGWSWTSYLYIHAAPDPIGLGQKVYFMFWLAMPIPTASGNTGDRWTGIMMNITKPDGTIVKKGPYTLPGPGLTGEQFTDTNQIGFYNVSLYFPGQTVQLAGVTGLNSTAASSFTVMVNDTWTPAWAITNFTVQQDPLQYQVTPPIPASYWTRPIDNNNFLTWYQISGSWLTPIGSSNVGGGSNYWKFQPYGYAPQSAHIMWTKEVTWGGVVGGDNSINNYAGGWKAPFAGNQMTFYSGTQYQLRMSNPIIMYQTLYVQLPADASQANTGGGFAAISLTTGETLWVREDLTGFGGSPMFGQFYDFDSVNQHGTTGVYLWFSTTTTGTGLRNPAVSEVNAIKGTYPPGYMVNVEKTVGAGSISGGNYSTSGWLAIDPRTGNNAFNETNIPTGTNEYGPQGEWLRYGLVRQNSSTPVVGIWEWNNTRLPGNDQTGSIVGWTPYGGSYNMSAAYDYNVTLVNQLGSPQGLNNGPINTYAAGTNTSYSPVIVHAWPGNMILGQSSNLQQLGTTEAYFGTSPQYELWAINLNASRGPVGMVMWDRNYTTTGGNSTWMIGPQDEISGIFTMYIRETQTFYGFSLTTGDLVWGPTISEDAFNYFTGVTALTWPGALGYGNLYNAGHSGIVYAFNLTTGETLFTYGNNASDPLNSTRTIETAYGGYPTQIAAVSYNTLYAFPEEHSIDAPAYRGARIRAIDAITGQEKWKLMGMAPYQSSAVADGYLVFYNLMDGREYAIGPGPSATTVSAPGSGVVVGSPMEITGTVTDQSPNKDLKGTPAISDVDQGPWMEYMVEHTALKPFASGVPVSLTVVDSTGAVAAQTTVTSDSSGLFHYAWTPTTAGEFTIYASFDGSESYGPSSAGTATVVAKAPLPAVTATPTPTPAITVPPTTTTPTTPAPVQSPTGEGLSATDMYLIVVAAVVIIIVVAAAVILRRRK